MGSRAPLFKSSVHRIAWFARDFVQESMRCDSISTVQRIYSCSCVMSPNSFFPDVSILEHFSSWPPVAPQSMHLFLPVTCLLPPSLSTSPLLSGPGLPPYGRACLPAGVNLALPHQPAWPREAATLCRASLSCQTCRNARQLLHHGPVSSRQSTPPHGSSRRMVK